MLKTVYKLLESPKTYDLVQKILGGNRVYSLIKEKLCSRLEDVPACEILDIGCGTGTFANAFRGSYCGIDINPEYITKAQATKTGTFLCGDATSLPFQSDSFSLIFTLGVLHHLDNKSRTKMLKEMWRVCRPNGRLLIVDGIIPSNRANILGYVLAKLDRGRFKMFAPQFEEMIRTSIDSRSCADFTYYKVFPYELAFVEIIKHDISVDSQSAVRKQDGSL